MATELLKDPESLRAKKEKDGHEALFYAYLHSNSLVKCNEQRKNKKHTLCQQATQN